MNHRAFTLLEMVFVFGIIAILGTVVTLGWSSLGQHSQAEDVEQHILSILRQAREKTMARIDGYSYGVHLESSRVTLFAAPTYVSGAASNVVYTLPGAFYVASYTLRGGGSDILFQSLTGETRQDGSITVTSTATSKTLHVYTSGYADAQ